MVASGKLSEHQRTKRSLWIKRTINGRALSGRADASAFIRAHLAARGSLIVSMTSGGVLRTCHWLPSAAACAAR